MKVVLMSTFSRRDYFITSIFHERRISTCLVSFRFCLRMNICRRWHRRRRVWKSNKKTKRKKKLHHLNESVSHLALNLCSSRIACMRASIDELLRQKTGFRMKLKLKMKIGLRKKKIDGMHINRLPVFAYSKTNSVFPVKLFIHRSENVFVVNLVYHRNQSTRVRSKIYSTDMRRYRKLNEMQSVDRNWSVWMEKYIDANDKCQNTQTFLLYFSHWMQRFPALKFSLMFPFSWRNAQTTMRQ